MTIFFTQVFRDGFFHADMHPGNIQVSMAPATFGRYIALDFGIVGTLTEIDKEYLAQNFIAFFRRDYKRVAELHVESGWVPPSTRVDELEGAIRAVCEPHFDRPLKDISLGQVLLRLFQTSRRFNVEIQPQLVLLQKTLLNVEGLGRQLDPELDLWNTAKPFLERWMNEQVGWNGLVERLKNEAPRYAQLLPELPRLHPPGAAGAAAHRAAPARGAARRAAPHEPPAAGDRLWSAIGFVARAAGDAGLASPGTEAGTTLARRRAQFPALKLVKMRVCTRRMSCGRLSGAVIVARSCWARGRSTCCRPRPWLDELERFLVRVGVEDLVRQRRVHFRAQDVVDEQVRVLRVLGILGNRHRVEEQRGAGLAAPALRSTWPFLA